MIHWKGFSIKNILLGYMDVLVFIIIMQVKAIYSLKQISADAFSIESLFLPTLSSILILTAVAMLFKNKTRTIVLLVLNIIISAILIIDTVYYGYFKDIISVAAVRNSLLLGGVSSSVKSVLKGSDFIILIDIVFFIIFSIAYTKINKKQYLFKTRVTIFLGIFILGSLIDFKYIYKLNIDKPRLMHTMSNKLYIVKSLGNLNFHFLDLCNFTSTGITSKLPINDQREKEIQVFLQSDIDVKKDNFSGIGTGKNLIAIQVEALQQFVIGAKVNGEEITPNINKLIGKSLYFDNFFYQIAEGNTSDAEFMVNNSLYPAASGAAYFRYDEKDYTSLPGQLKDLGYYTAAFHGNDETFWNRNIMYDLMGFKDFFGKSSFSIDEIVGMGISDKSFLTQSLDKIKTFKQPFYSFMITLSSHYPFEDIKSYGNFDVNKYEGTLLGNYFKAIHYTDTQLGIFLEELEKEGILDNSILLLYGDHNALPKDYSNDLFEFLNIDNANDLDWYQLQKVPMLIHFPNDSIIDIDHTYSGQMDLYPTLANIFSLPEKNMFGKDILNPSDETVIFRNGSFTDGDIFYISWNDKFYNISSGEEIPSTDQLLKLQEAADAELSYSDDVLNHNLIKVFGEK